MCKLLGAAILSLLYSLPCFLSGLEDCLEQVGADIHQLLLRNRSHQTLVALDDNCLCGRILWLTQLGSPTLDTLIPARSCWLAGRGGAVGTAVTRWGGKEGRGADAMAQAWGSRDPSS